MRGYYGDTPSETDGCPRWAAGECDCPPGSCDIDDEIAVRNAEGERDYPEVDWSTDRECGS